MAYLLQFIAVKKKISFYLEWSTEFVGVVNLTLYIYLKKKNQ